MYVSVIDKLSNVIVESVCIQRALFNDGSNIRFLKFSINRLVVRFFVIVHINFFSVH